MIFIYSCAVVLNHTAQDYGDFWDSVPSITPSLKEVDGYEMQEDQTVKFWNGTTTAEVFYVRREPSEKVEGLYYANGLFFKSRPEQWQCCSACYSALPSTGTRKPQE